MATDKSDWVVGKVLARHARFAPTIPGTLLVILELFPFVHTLVRPTVSGS